MFESILTVDSKNLLHNDVGFVFVRKMRDEIGRNGTVPLPVISIAMRLS